MQAPGAKDETQRLIGLHLAADKWANAVGGVIAGSRQIKAARINPAQASEGALAFLNYRDSLDAHLAEPAAAEPIVSALLGILAHESDDLPRCRAAASVLRELSAIGEAAPALLKLLKHPDRVMVQEGLMSLTDLPPYVAKTALPDLRVLCDAEDPRVKDTAALLLGMLTSE